MNLILFSRYIKGSCEKRMGQVVKQDMVLLVIILLAILSNLGNQFANEHYECYIQLNERILCPIPLYVSRAHHS